MLKKDWNKKVVLSIATFLLKARWLTRPLKISRFLPVSSLTGLQGLLLKNATRLQAARCLRENREES